MKFKNKYLLLLGITICILGIVGGCRMFGDKQETLTKEQQNNVVKRIVRNYNIQSIEFTKFSKDKKTGTYHLLFIINGEKKYQTGISIRDLKRLSNSTDEVGLSPVDIFKTLERGAPLSVTDVDISDIQITYLGE
ncbi:hypothetical protein [Streptococcus ferus]|uniref:hypothetical protein n=1 Tax=Streptococcus ferus TaxID=1345 RepID=UPI002353B177|nr:hypothetical protein [Streptococcus ferus]